MDIVIVAQFLGDIENTENDNNRFVYLGNLLSKKNDVEIITTDFVHSLKKHITNVNYYNNCKITCLHEGGYSRNVCLKRFLSHRQLSKNVKKYLQNRKKPDVIYCAVPSLDVAYEAAKYAKKNKIPFIIDIQDLWPEAFQMVFNLPIISDLIFTPLKIKANKIYKLADHIVAVSETYVRRAKKVNSKVNTTIAFLGADLSQFDSYVNREKNNSKVKIGYIGTLGNSYDITSVLKAMQSITKEELEKLEFIVMGDGPLMDEFKKAAKGLPVEFTGRLPYEKMVNKLSSCHIAVNPIRKGSAGSIINKVGDYAMAGLPVINTQECKEYRDLINLYGAGINCECENSHQIANAILTFLESEDLQKKMGAANRKMAIEKFDRATTYKEIVKVISGD